MTVTGEASEKLLKAIIFGATPDKSASTEKPAIPEETIALIKVVQEVLAKMGYDPGPVDGLIGPGTARAIRSFEEQQKMPQKGRISGKVLKALIEVTGADLASIQSP
jgi:peptidoglycan hydrolase-like protein with peptidoglycan-binding domain